MSQSIINTLANPFVAAPTGKHKHLCDKCGTCWMHSDEMRGNEHAHSCPTCGAEQWEKYYPERERQHNEHDVECVLVLYALFAAIDNEHQRRVRSELARQFYCEL